MGATLVTMTEVQKPFNVFDSSFKSLAKYYDNNQTYEMRNFISSGLFYQLFTVLEEKLNFTGQLLKRKDGKWGAKDITKANGMFFSYESICFYENKKALLLIGWNGMIENLLDQSADMIAASLTMNKG